MLSKIRKFLKNEKGATMIEYALLAALVSIAAIGTLTAIGPKLITTFTAVDTGLGPSTP